MWLALALVAALCTAGKETLVKLAMRETDEYVIVFAMSGISALLLAPAALMLLGFLLLSLA